MKYTLDTLMAQVGCEKYPARWQEIFENAMAEYDRQGCYLADPSYYDALHEKYGCMENFGEFYRRAAVQVASDEALGRFLTLLAMALQDREHRKADVKELSVLRAPEGKEPLAYNMAMGLAICSQLDEANRNLLARGVPDQHRFWALHTAVDCGIKTYMRRNNGEPGYHLLSWAQLYIDANIFSIERLEMEFSRPFRGCATVYENDRGEQIALADGIRLHRDGFALGSIHFEDEEGAWDAAIEEDETYVSGYPYRADGYVDSEKVTLRRDEWHVVLKSGDPIISIHIPSGKIHGPLTPERVDETIAAAREFAAKYFPDYPYKAFACSSWLMDPQLVDIVGAESNIGKFVNRFHAMTVRSRGEAVFNFVFNQPDVPAHFEDLPEGTRLEKGLKQLYLDGKALYEMVGYFM